MKAEAKTNFWQNFKTAAPGRPILALAPMAGITDSAFRQICKDFGADVVYSEMASAAALFFQPKKTLELLRFDPSERPYVVQLFGADPEHFIRAVKIVEKKIKPDGFDINFGCPVKKVAKQGAGAVLMDRPKEAHEIVKAVVSSTGLPVSIKIRTLSGKTDALRFLDKLNDLPLAAVMIHGRSMSQGHAGLVDTMTIKKARNHFAGIILANGGVTDLKTAYDLFDQTGADGLGIARGALGRPWIFDNIKRKIEKGKSREETFGLAIKHAGIAFRLKGAAGLIEMRKHLCWYVAGQTDASELRRGLVLVSSLKEIKKILQQ